MRCREALERILEADPAELRGEGDTDLARHIAGCERCAPVAAAILDELDAVDAALAEFAASGPTAADAGVPKAHAAADAAANAALAAVRAEGAEVGSRVRGTGDDRPPASTSWGRRAWIPLAAAAALVGILVLRQTPGPPPGTPSAEVPTVEPRVSVTPPAEKGAAIMETENPNITIVWLYEREES